MQLLEDPPPGERAEGVLQIFQARLAHPLHAAEGLDQQLAAAGTDAGQLVEAAVESAGGAAAPVARDGEAVGLVADLLEQAQAGVVAPETERLRHPGNVDLLLALGERDDRRL